MSASRAISPSDWEGILEEGGALRSPSHLLTGGVYWRSEGPRRHHLTVCLAGVYWRSEGARGRYLTFWLGGVYWRNEGARGHHLTFWLGGVYWRSEGAPQSPSHLLTGRGVLEERGAPQSDLTFWLGGVYIYISSLFTRLKTVQSKRRSNTYHMMHRMVRRSVTSSILKPGT